VVIFHKDILQNQIIIINPSLTFFYG